jgi:MerR family copper efflux transcriptional regulator
MSALRISELAERAQVPVSTVRYYERIGLLRPPERFDNGYRRYNEAAVEQLVFIGRAKKMGVPLDQVSELLEVWSNGGCQPLQDRIRAFLAGRIAEVRLQQVDLGAFERQLQGLFDRIDDRDRIEGRDGTLGMCELDCECVHLPEPMPPAGCCAPLAHQPGQPVPGCSLEANAQSDRIMEWRTLLGEGEIVERSGRGLRVQFPNAAGLAGRLAELCASEASCCSFLSFSMDIGDRKIALTIGCPDGPDARAAIERIFGPAPEPVLR